MNKTASILLACLLTSAFISSGCMIVDHESPGCYGDECGLGPGNMGFWWSFELADGTTTDSCQMADVARVDVRVYDNEGYLEYSVLDRPCGDLGLDLTNFASDWYDIQLVGRCSSGTTTHEGWFNEYIYPGVNELGVLTLDYLGPCS